MESGSDGRSFKGKGAGWNPRGGWESVDGGVTHEDALEGWCMTKRPSKRSVARNAHYPALNGNGNGRPTPWLRGRADALRVGGVARPRGSRVPDSVSPLTPSGPPLKVRPPTLHFPIHPGAPPTCPGQQAHRAWQGPLPPQIFTSGPRPLSTRAPHIALQSGSVEQRNPPVPQLVTHNLEKPAVVAEDAPSREYRTPPVTGVGCENLGASGCPAGGGKLTPRVQCGTRISLADLMACVSHVPARRHGLPGGADPDDVGAGDDEPVMLFDSRGHLPRPRLQALHNSSGTFCFGTSALQLLGACVPLLAGFLGPKPDMYITEANMHVRRILANMVLSRSQDAIPTYAFRAAMSGFNDKQQHCINEFMDSLLQEVAVGKQGQQQGELLPSIVAALATTKVVWGTCAKPTCLTSQPVVPGLESRISFQHLPGLRLRVPAGDTPLPLEAAIQGTASCNGVAAACQSCGHDLEASTMRIRLWGEPPMVLPCYLDRLESVNGQEHRIERRVEVQENMVIECMTTAPQEVRSISYSVVGVALHTGTSQRGHYRAIVRRPAPQVESSEFLLYDDSHPVQAFINLQAALTEAYKCAGPSPVVTTVMLVRSDSAFLPVGSPLPVALDLLRQARRTATSVAETDVKGTKAY